MPGAPSRPVRARPAAREWTASEPEAARLDLPLTVVLADPCPVPTSQRRAGPRAAPPAAGASGSGRAPLGLGLGLASPRRASP